MLALGTACVLCVVLSTHSAGSTGTQTLRAVVQCFLQVTYTRTPPGGIVAGAAAFQAVGDVFITNSSPLNAQLKEVTVSISNPFGGSPYRTTATCPILTVAAGQTLQCRYVASPSFNPIGAQVVGIAHYLNQRNGLPTGATTPFTSAAVTMAGGVSPREPQAMPTPAAPGVPAAPVPSMVIPSVSRRHLLASGVNEALSNVVRQVSVTTHSGRAPGSSVGIAAAQQPIAVPRQNMGQRVVKDILKNIVAALDDSNKGQDKREAGNGGSSTVTVSHPAAHALPNPGSMMLNLLKNMTIDNTQGGNSTQDVVEMLVHLLPTLPSMGITMEGTDWADILTTMRGMLPDEGFAGLIKKLGHMPNIKLPKLPKLPTITMPIGPTITYNTTGPIEDDYEERTLEGISKVLTKITHLVERNNKSTITITTKAMTPEKMLQNALEAIAKAQHKDDGTTDVAPEDTQESGTLKDAAAATANAAGEQLLAEQAPAPAPVSPFQLQGLSDECVDVADAFAAGNGYTTGMVVSGALPSGRICDTTTFTYTVRYGPYAECFDRKAMNKATFTTVDTNTTGEASTTTNVQVQGCGPAVTASIKSYAVWAKKGFTWTVQKSASPSKLELKGNSQGQVDYTVSYTRSEVLTAPKLSATVQFDNLKLNGPAHLNTFSYKVTSNCPEGNQVKTGTFTCQATTIPAGGAPLSCKFKVDLPCSAPGVLLANAVVEDKAVRSNAFNFPSPEPTELETSSSDDDQLSTGECVMVSQPVTTTSSCCCPCQAGRPPCKQASICITATPYTHLLCACLQVTDEFKQGQWLVGGNVTNQGSMPYGKLCGSKVFTYSATFGPFKNCGKKKVCVCVCNTAVHAAIALLLCGCVSSNTCRPQLAGTLLADSVLACLSVCVFALPAAQCALAGTLLTAPVLWLPCCCLLTAGHQCGLSVCRHTRQCDAVNGHTAHLSRGLCSVHPSQEGHTPRVCRFQHHRECNRRQAGECGAVTPAAAAAAG